MRATAERLSAHGVWRVGRDLRVRCSNGAARLLGLGAGETSLLLTDLAARIDVADRPAAVAAAKSAFDSLQALDLVFGYQRPNGEHVRLHVAAHPELSLDGRLEAMAGALVEAAPASRTFNDDSSSRSFVRDAPALMCLLDRDLRFVEVSEPFAAGFHLPQGGAAGKAILEVLPWIPERWRRAFRRALDGETARADSDAYDTPRGRTRWAQWVCAPWRNSAGEICGVLVSGADITESVGERACIEASQRRMSFGLDMSDIMICEFDLERREVFVDGDWKQFFPRYPTLNCLIGEDPAVADSDRDMLASQWVAHLGGSPPYSVEYRVQLGDGREIWHAATVQIQRAAHGAPCRAIAVIQDVTLRKAAEDRLREAELRALVAAAAKGDFLANISHEIRTPLNGVLAVAEMLQRTPLNDRQAEMVRMVCDSGQTLLRVMDDIVEYTGIEADAIELDNRPFDLEATLRLASEAGRARAEAKGLHFECFISAALDGVFRGDPVRIGQVVGNLLNNAVKFTNQGVVRFSASAAAVNDHTEVRLVVSDTGSGFEPELAERIFDRFVQADGSTSRAHGGLGLGLSIVKRLVDLMGGRVTASAQPGEGATFEVALPLVRDRIAALGTLQLVMAEGVEAESRLENIRVLVAEDNPMNRRVVELLLGQAEVELAFAENGREAVDRFVAGRYDLVLMDLQMPVMDGLSATRAIRDFERKQNRIPTPILALSANASDGHKREASEAGADEHIAKPIVREILFDAIARHARRPSRMDDDIDLDELDLAV